MEQRIISPVILLVIVTALALAGCASQETGTGLPTGTVEAREVDVNAKIPGRIVELLVTEGDEVTAGQVVAKMEDKDLKAKENQILAQVEAARTQLQKARTAVNVTEQTVNARIERAGAALERARAEAGLAGKTLERIQLLFEQGAVPQQQLDEAVAKEQAAKTAVDEATAALAEAEAARLQVTLTKEEVNAAAAQYKQALAALQEVRNNLAELEIKAPQAGTVTAVNVEEGELVSTGLPVISLTDFKDNWVQMQVNQDIVQSLQLHQKAEIIAGKESYTGEIVHIGHKPSFATRRATSERGEKDIITYGVRIQVNNPALRPGMNVEVKFMDTTGGGQDAA